MTEAKQKNNSTKNAILAGITGVIAGGAAVAAAVALSDSNNQKKMKKTLEETKGKVSKYIDTIAASPVVKKNTEKIKDTVEHLSENFKSEKNE